VLDALWARGRDWLPGLLALPEYGCGAVDTSLDLTLLEGHWEPKERCLPPPVSLLAWCIRNAGRLGRRAITDERRRKLVEGDPEMVGEALRRLRTDDAQRSWFIFEGPTCPDAVLVSPDAIVVLEGKRTESGTTTETVWLSGRHQIWRHLDAAWELRGRRAVYGLFVVESSPDSPAALIPEHWQRDARACLDPAALESSFPHRSTREIADISKCYLGVTTWRHVCERFGINWKSLPHDTSQLGA
jgi:hypothetical protein